MHQWMSSRLSILLIAIHCTLKHTSTWNICSRLESRDGKKRVDDYYLELTQNPCICCCWWTMMIRWLVFHIRSCFLLLLLPDGGAADGVDDDDAAAFNPKSNDDENDAFSRARFVMFCVWIIYIQFWIWIELCMVVSLPPLAALIEMHIYIYHSDDHTYSIETREYPFFALFTKWSSSHLLLTHTLAMNAHNNHQQHLLLWLLLLLLLLLRCMTTTASLLMMMIMTRSHTDA